MLNRSSFFVVLLFVGILGLLALVGLQQTALAQGVEDLPEDIGGFFSVDALPLLLGIVAAVIETWLVRLWPDVTSTQLIWLTIVLQLLIAVTVVLVAQLVPAAVLDEYGVLYAAIRAFLISLAGNQVMYHGLLRPAQHESRAG